MRGVEVFGKGGGSPTIRFISSVERGLAWMPLIIRARMSEGKDGFLYALREDTISSKSGASWTCTELQSMTVSLSNAVYLLAATCTIVSLGYPMRFAYSIRLSYLDVAKETTTRLSPSHPTTMQKWGFAESNARCAMKYTSPGAAIHPPGRYTRKLRKEASSRNTSLLRSTTS